MAHTGNAYGTFGSQADTKADEADGVSTEHVAAAAATPVGDHVVGGCGVMTASKGDEDEVFVALLDYDKMFNNGVNPAKYDTYEEYFLAVMAKLKELIEDIRTRAAGRPIYVLSFSNRQSGEFEDLNAMQHQSGVSLVELAQFAALINAEAATPLSEASEKFFIRIILADVYEAAKGLKPDKSNAERIMGLLNKKVHEEEDLFSATYDGAGTTMVRKPPKTVIMWPADAAAERSVPARFVGGATSAVEPDEIDLDQPGQAIGDKDKWSLTYALAHFLKQTELPEFKGKRIYACAYDDRRDILEPLFDRFKRNPVELPKGFKIQFLHSVAGSGEKPNGICETSGQSMLVEGVGEVDPHYPNTIQSCMESLDHRGRSRSGTGDGVNFLSVDSGRVKTIRDGQGGDSRAHELVDAVVMRAQSHCDTCRLGGLAGSSVSAARLFEMVSTHKHDDIAVVSDSPSHMGEVKKAGFSTPCLQFYGDSTGRLSGKSILLPRGLAL